MNTWFSGARLYIDAVHVATSRKFLSLSRRSPLFEHTLTDASTGAVHKIHVFVLTWLTVQVAIFVNGVQHGGEVLDIGTDALRFKTDAGAVKTLSTMAGSVGIPVRLGEAGGIKRPMSKPPTDD